jgi:hypothetical protein
MHNTSQSPVRRSQTSSISIYPHTVPSDNLSAASGTTLARALIANSFVLSTDHLHHSTTSRRRSSYWAGGRQDSATLPKGENPFAHSPYWKDRRISAASVILVTQDEDEEVPPVPPVPAQLGFLSAAPTTISSNNTSRRTSIRSQWSSPASLVADAGVIEAREEVVERRTDGEAEREGDGVIDIIAPQVSTDWQAASEATTTTTQDNGSDTKSRVVDLHITKHPLDPPPRSSSLAARSTDGGPIISPRSCGLAARSPDGWSSVPAATPASKGTNRKSLNKRTKRNLSQLSALSPSLLALAVEGSMDARVEGEVVELTRLSVIEGSPIAVRDETVARVDDGDGVGGIGEVPTPHERQQQQQQQEQEQEQEQEQQQQQRQQQQRQEQPVSPAERDDKADAYRTSSSERDFKGILHNYKRTGSRTPGPSSAPASRRSSWKKDQKIPRRKRRESGSNGMRGSLGPAAATAAAVRARYGRPSGEP